MGLVFKAYGVNEEQRLVFGIASLALDASGQTYTDLQADQIEPAELEKAFYDSMARGRTSGDVNHDHSDKTVQVEQFVVTPEKLGMLLKAFGATADLSNFKGMGVWVGYRVKDNAAWAAVKRGELDGFSIEGDADRVPA